MQKNFRGKRWLVFSIFFFGGVISQAREFKSFDGYNFEASSESPHSLQLVESNDQALWQRLDLIRRAQHSILVDVFYFKPDESGKIILSALLHKKIQHPNIEINLHLDSWGSSDFDMSFVALLQNHGIHVRKYEGPKFLLFGPRRKNHRKTWIVDDRWALIGGYNMGNEHFGFSPVFNMVDRDVLIEGPIVPSMTEAYNQLWKLSSDTECHVAAASMDDLPAPISALKPSAMPAPIGVSNIRYLTNINRRDESEPRLKNKMDEILRSAKSHITIEAKFFYPALSTVAILLQKIYDKIQVKVFSNKKESGEDGDREALFLGSKFLGGLEFQGAEVKYFSGALPGGPGQAMTKDSQNSRWGTHAKTIVVDNTVVLGSFNLDLISDYLNIEHFIVVESPALATATLESIHKRTLKAD
jgi:putative cardiolipin synthase